MIPESKIVLGTVQFGLDYGVNNRIGKPTEHDVKSILDFAHEQGITTIDTATAYGDSEIVLGNYFKKDGYSFEVISKLDSTSSSTLTDSLQTSLDRLQIKNLYAYLYHSFESMERRYGEDQSEINEVVSGGFVQKIGVSVYTNEELEKSLNYSEIKIIQVPFNLLDNHIQRGKYFKRAHELGIEIHTRSAFLQGLFFKPIEEIPESLSALKPALKHIREITKRYNTNLETIALWYVCKQELIDKVLIGVDSLTQLQKNIRSLHVILPNDVMLEIEGIIIDNPALLYPSNWKL
ncbi:MAG: aldo/keto reductase [Bacteroidetes bacterium]|nr:aldo/keto reductase [Bacteroidota bacterium]